MFDELDFVKIKSFFALLWSYLVFLVFKLYYL